MELIIINAGGKAPRSARIGDRDYLVAPMTLIVPGVLAGSQGALYYPESEVGIWNHVPLVVYHPTKEGEHVSARDAEVLNEAGVGIVLNDRMEDGKRVAEGWFDLGAVKRWDAKSAPNLRLLPKLQSGKQIELSTGLDLDAIPAPPDAVHNGVSYFATAVNYRPDHVAILPGEKGACSVDDGCGVNNRELTWEDVLRNLSYTLVNNAQGRSSDGTFGSGEGEHEEEQDGPKTSKKSKDKADSKTPQAAKAGSAEAASRAAEQKTRLNNSRGKAMNRKDMITYLVANCGDTWKGKGDKALLEKMGDKQLQSLVGNAKMILVVNQARKVFANKKANSNDDAEAVAGVPWTELAALVGVDIDPPQHPVGFTSTLTAALDPSWEAQPRLRLNPSCRKRKTPTRAAWKSQSRWAKAEAARVRSAKRLPVAASIRWVRGLVIARRRLRLLSPKLSGSRRLRREFAPQSRTP